MGCFDGICTLTNLPILEGDDCVQVVLRNSVRRDYLGPEHVFRKTVALDRGQYGGYGTITDIADEEETFPILFKLSSWNWLLNSFRHRFSGQEIDFSRWMLYLDVPESCQQLAEEWFIVVQVMVICLGRNILGAIDTQTQISRDRLDDQQQLVLFMLEEIARERERDADE